MCTGAHCDDTANRSEAKAKHTHQEKYYVLLGAVLHNRN